MMKRDFRYEYVPEKKLFRIPKVSLRTKNYTR
jgi:hypothetical protein